MTTRRWIAGISIASFIIIYMLIATALYLQFTPVGGAEILGVQSRYYLPLVPLLLVAVLCLFLRKSEDGKKSLGADSASESSLMTRVRDNSIVKTQGSIFVVLSFILQGCLMLAELSRSLF
jgi:uncharacterized membrane protein